MATYRFKTDVPEPTDEQIGKHKNFGKLRANYQQATKPLYKTPLYKNKKVFLALILLALVAYLIAEFMEEKKPTRQTPPGNQSGQPAH
jgi:hypothetical protein